MSWHLKNVMTQEVVLLKEDIFVIGRDITVNLVCRSGVVSRNHAKLLKLLNGSLRVVDNGSSNGTFVNNHKLKAYTDYELHVDDEIGFGLFRKREGFPNNFVPPYYIYKVIKEPKEIDDFDKEGVIKSKHSSNLHELVKASTSNEKKNLILSTNKNNEYVPKKEKIINVSETGNNLENKIISVPELAEKDKLKNNVENLEENHKKKEINENEFIHNNLLAIPTSSNFNANFAKPSTSKDDDYSYDDHVIIIDDDEDENDFCNFMCSQLYIKQEKRDDIDEKENHQKIDDDIFLNIKKEVEYLDNFEDSSKVPPITVFDSMEWSDSDDELFKNLADENPLVKIEEEHTSDFQNSNTPILPDDFSKNLNNLDSVNIIHYEMEKKDDRETSMDEGSNSLVIDERQTTLSNSKPIVVIEALPLKITKNTSLVNPPPKKSKQDKTPKSKSLPKTRKRKNSTDRTYETVNKKAKEQIQEVRRKKLKSLAAKASTETNEVQRSRINTTKQIKISEGRGTFLLPKEPLPEQFKNKKCDKPKISKENNCVSNVPNKNKREEPKVTTNINRSKNNSENLSHISKNLNKASYRRKKIQLVTKFNHTIHKNLLENWDVILSLIKWNVSWFSQEKIKKSPPPVTDKLVIKMCNTFANFQDYYDVLQPLIVLDYWYSLSKEYESTQFLKHDQMTDTFMAYISNINKCESYMELTCYKPVFKAYMVKENMNYLREKNFVLLTLEFEGVKKLYKTIFGVVAWIHKETLKPDDEIQEDMAIACIENKKIPNVKLTFMLIVKSCEENIKMEIPFYGRYFPAFAQCLRLISSVKSVENSPLKRHILEPSISDYNVPYIPDKTLYLKNVLNGAQKRAVLEASHLCVQDKPGFYLIEGPPGTGKTTVITNIILEILLNQSNYKEQCILLLAPSNGAIDHLVNKIVNDIKPSLKAQDRQRIKLVRIGKQKSMSSAVVSYSIEELAKHNVKNTFLAEHPQARRDYEILSKEIKQLKQRLQYNQKDEKLNKELRSKMFEQENFAKQYLKNRYNDKIQENMLIILKGANLICSTIGSCSKIFIPGFNVSNIKSCIIDEATQCSEPETLVPLGMGIRKFVLVGDPRQLPAVTSILSKNFGYGNSLFSRIKYNLSKNPAANPIRMLNIQYRMHSEISQFPNNTYYNGLIKNDYNFKTRPELQMLNPYMVFNQNILNRNQYYNIYEVDCIIGLIEAVVHVVGTHCSLSIGVITLYTNQRDAICKKLKQLHLPQGVLVTCNTVDSFQGQEKDIILLSCVRSSSNMFSSDEQRLNVAITRAKFVLYIVGSQSLFENCHTLRKLKHDAEMRNYYYNLTCKLDSPQIFAKLITKK